MSQESRERRASLLQAATQVFSQKGYHQASVADIIEYAGVARGTFYLYFQSKRHVFDCILDHLLQQIQGAIRPIRLEPGAPSPLEQLRDTLRRIISFALREKEQTRILLDRAIGLDKESDARLTEFYESLLSSIDSAIRHGIALGFVRPCATHIAARCILGSMKEIVGHVSLSGQAVDELDEILDEILNFGLNGLLVSSTYEPAVTGQQRPD